MSEEKGQGNNHHHNREICVSLVIITSFSLMQKHVDVLSISFLLFIKENNLLFSFSFIVSTFYLKMEIQVSKMFYYHT